MSAGTERRTLLALFGPTSSGKTVLSVEVAQRLERLTERPVVVISADSRQVYTYMDIGTSKTTAEQMRGIRHEMIDVAEPMRKLELEDYARIARDHMTDVFAAGGIPFVVGGTGVYVKALLEGWELEEVGATRNALRRDFPRAMAGDAYAMLRRLDRAKATRIHPNNYEAIINALAGLIGAGDRSKERGMRTVLLGVDPGLRKVDRRVEETYAAQMAAGLFDEICRLNARYDLDAEIRRRGRETTNQVLHTHGYREYFEVALERGRTVAELDRRDLAEVRVRVLEHIRAFTRRQRAWLRKVEVTRMVRSPAQAVAAVTAVDR